jgi:AcrR family transcriptional regulator
MAYTQITPCCKITFPPLQGEFGVATTGKHCDMNKKRGNYSSPRQQQRQETILATARRLIAEKGYSGLTMRDLATASKVSEKTLYNLYESKDRLVMQAVADLLEAIVQGVEAQARRPGLDTILLYSQAMTGQILATPAYALAMAQALFQADAGNPLVKVLLESNEAYLELELQHALMRGELQQDTNVQQLARLILANMWGVLLLWQKGLLTLQALPGASTRSLCLCLGTVARGQGKKLVNRRLAASV